jgi:hypothetical protein
MQQKKHLSKLLVVIVINNSTKDSKSIVNNNLLTYKRLSIAKYNYEIILIDCFSKKMALNNKTGGVGLARKIGMDYCINYATKESLFCSLDADTLISKSYLAIIAKTFNQLDLSAAVVDFKHQKANDKKIQVAIDKYEKLLKKIAKNIQKTGSPYGFVSMGSTMICTLQAYISIGGMPPKQATEDFYFLQKLAKYDKVHFINQILVSPSSRLEQRVYLGTGFRLKQFQKNNHFEDLKVDKKAFNSLKYFYTIIDKKWNLKSIEILSSITENNSKLYHYLNENNFINKVDKIKKNSITKLQFLNQFHKWFDGLKVYKFLKLYGN